MVYLEFAIVGGILLLITGGLDYGRKWMGGTAKTTEPPTPEGEPSIFHIEIDPERLEGREPDVWDYLQEPRILLTLGYFASTILLVLGTVLYLAGGI